MRCIIVFIILLCVLFSVNANAAMRTFGILPDQLRVSGYTEVEMRVWGKDGRKTDFNHRIWFNGCGDYRIESRDFIPGSGQENDVYAIRCGRHLFSCTVWPDSHTQTGWSTSPESWMPHNMDTFLLRRVTLENPTRLSIGHMYGLRTEHWRGRIKGKYGSVVSEVWISIDQRFPLVLRLDSHSAENRSVWQISRIDLNPVPWWIFTPQVHPKPGLLHLAVKGFLPLPMALLWYVLIICSYSGAMLSLVLSPKRKQRSILGIASWLGIIGLLSISPKYNFCYYELSDTPFILISTCLVAIAILFVWRKTNGLGNVSIIRGTRWTIIFPMLLAVAAAWASSFVMRKLWSMSYDINITHLPFLPITLLNVLIYMIAWVTLEEVLFRGYLFNALLRRFHSPMHALIAQALIFGLYHLPKEIRMGWGTAKIAVDIIGIFIIGIIFGILRLRYRNLGAAWLVHLIYNTIIFYVRFIFMYNCFRAI